MDSAQITPAPSAATSVTRRRATLFICGLLLTFFAVVSYSAVLTKNATIDEPTQAMSGWEELRHGDYRIETVSPPLWQLWASLGNLFSDPKPRYEKPLWQDSTWDPAAEVAWSSRTLFGTPGVDGAAFINRARAMMLLLGLGLGAMIAFWTYKLAGSVAAIVALTLFCFDPNFLGHAPLVKSDVAFSLALFSLAFASWRLGQRATPARLVAVGLLCSAVVGTKFSGVIAGPLLCVLLLARAVSRSPWPFLKWNLHSSLQRVVAGVCTGVFAAICCFAVTWASYGFRYRVAPAASVHMNMHAIYDRSRRVETTVDLNRIPSPAEVQVHPPGSVDRFVAWADGVHLFPQAMLAGLLYQHTCVQLWPAFLNGTLYGDGKWEYFPLAALYKMPIAALAACGLALFVLGPELLHQRRRLPKSRDAMALAFDSWSITCLAVPFFVFCVAALTAHLNIGLRNALPLFPFVYVAVGCAAAVAWRRRPRVTGIVLGAMAVGLTAETLSAWPDYVAFFNAGVGGPRGGIAHLGDSNLDWGQDVKTLAGWQRRNPNVTLYARLYDSIEPGFYKLKTRPLFLRPDGDFYSDTPIEPGVIALSATHLQGLYVKPDEANFYRKFRETAPLSVLAGTIYLYEFRPDRR